MNLLNEEQMQRLKNASKRLGDISEVAMRKDVKIAKAMSEEAATVHAAYRVIDAAPLLFAEAVGCQVSLQGSCFVATRKANPEPFGTGSTPMEALADLMDRFE